MFKKLLIPLDGSRLSESVLVATRYFAEKLNASIALVHAIEKGAPSHIHNQQHLTTVEQAQTYLHKITDTFFNGFHIDIHVHKAAVDDIASSILAHALEFHSDCIVMCTHGNGGLRRAVVGSVAQQIVSEGTLPVLLFKPDEKVITTSFECKNILVPYDSKVEHEAGIRTSIDIGQVLDASLVLLQVVPTFSVLSGSHAPISRLLPGATTQLLDLEAGHFEVTLEQKKDELTKKGLHVTALLKRGKPARVIAKTSQENHIDLIVLGTHGKVGIEAFWANSLAAQLSSRCPTPMLLVPTSTGI